jgi:hypothetical protein
VDDSRDIGRLEGKVDLILNHLKEFREDQSKQDSRLGTLETKEAHRTGYTAAITAFVATAVSVAVGWLKNSGGTGG